MKTKTIIELKNEYNNAYLNYCEALNQMKMFEKDLYQYLLKKDFDQGEAVNQYYTMSNFVGYKLANAHEALTIINNFNSILHICAQLEDNE